MGKTETKFINDKSNWYLKQSFFLSISKKAKGKVGENDKKKKKLNDSCGLCYHMVVNYYFEIARA